MDSSILQLNTYLILDELINSPSEYLQLLTNKEREFFVNEWQIIVDKTEQLSAERLLLMINELVYKYPVLRSEFLGQTNIQEIGQSKFDPNAGLNTYDEKDTLSAAAAPSVKIINEVINVGKKLAQANEKLNDH